MTPQNRTPEDQRLAAGQPVRIQVDANRHAEYVAYYGDGLVARDAGKRVSVWFPKVRLQRCFNRESLVALEAEKGGVK